MSPANRSANLEITWPLYEEHQRRPLPTDPSQEVQVYAPPAADLRALTKGSQLPDLEEETAQARAKMRKEKSSLPPAAPEWMRAARTMADSLEAMIARGKVDAVENAAIARTWAAWSLGGVTKAYVLRVAHLVSRAHEAIHDGAKKPPTATAYQAAAGVLHGALPTAIRSRMPLERVVRVIRELYQETDRWVAVVEGAAEILSWKHYARVHAASVIRAMMEHKHVGG
jgi:hypothetical protein